MDDGRPLHAEMGYLRSVGDKRLEFIISQATGFAEVEVGTVADTRIDLQTQAILKSPTAKAVTAVRRVFWLDGQTLRYDLSMAMDTVPMAHHLSAGFRRAED